MARDDARSAGGRGPAARALVPPSEYGTRPGGVDRQGGCVDRLRYAPPVKGANKKKG